MTLEIQARTGGNGRTTVGEPTGLGAQLVALMHEIELYLAFWEHARDARVALGEGDGRPGTST